MATCVRAVLAGPSADVAPVRCAKGPDHDRHHDHQHHCHHRRRRRVIVEIAIFARWRGRRFNLSGCLFYQGKLNFIQKYSPSSLINFSPRSGFSCWEFGGLLFCAFIPLLVFFSLSLSAIKCCLLPGVK